MSKFSFKWALIITCLVGSRCTQTGNMEKWKEEIMQVEKEFNDMAQEEGLAVAFSQFAAQDGVLRRRKKIVSGPKEIKDWYEKDYREGDALTWKPTFVDVSASGDMAYTYGNYVFSSLDTLGKKKESTGIFHTVWKRQQDGSWKYVYD